MGDGKNATSILLAQFTALRGEIASRSQAQTTIMQLTLTALAALGALGFAEHGDKKLLLLVPVISAILGLIWLDHAANISNIGDFIKDHLNPALKAAGEMDDLPDYEVEVRKYEQNRSAVLRMFGFPPFLVFILVPAAAMTIAFNSADRNGLFWGLFALDCLLLMVFAIYWAPFLGGPRRKPSGR